MDKIRALKEEEYVGKKIHSFVGGVEDIVEMIGKMKINDKEDSNIQI